jgi:hypothetical protein
MARSSARCRHASDSGVILVRVARSHQHLGHHLVRVQDALDLECLGLLRARVCSQRVRCDASRDGIDEG